MELRKLWDRTKEFLEEELSEDVYERWIEPLEFDITSEGDNLNLIAPMELNKKEIKKYISFIDNTIYFTFDEYKIITVRFN